jgi:hypothetical protein
VIVAAIADATVATVADATDVTEAVTEEAIAGGSAIATPIARARNWHTQWPTSTG